MGTYDLLVYAHVLAFVFWLGGDLGVAILGSAFRDRTKSLPTRLEILRLLTVVDMGPRTAWVAMVPLSITLVNVGGYWDVPDWLLMGSWGIGAAWLVLTWVIHLRDPGPLTTKLKILEFSIKIVIMLGYGVVGVSAIMGYGPLEPNWLGWKALIFSGIFLVAIMIDVAGSAIGPLLAKLIQEGSSDATELPLRRAMDMSRLWVWATYILLFVIGYLGSVKPS
jgi:hypothetical protein